MTLSLVDPRVTATRRALARFVEEAADAQRDALLAPIERETALAVGRWFVEQGKEVIAALKVAIGTLLDLQATPRESAQRGTLREDLSANDWNYLIAQVMRRPYGGASQLSDIIGGARRRGYLAGSNVTRAQLGGRIPAFFLGNDDAVTYARKHAAAQVTRINETTRRELNHLIAEAVDKRLTWRETAALIEERYADMAGPPLFPSRTHRRRAQMIAAFETRDAYEAGGYEQARRLAESGMEVEKRWVYLRDGRARDAHRENGATGWMSLEAVFPDGTERPPSDGNCRCVLLYRARPGAPALAAGQGGGSVGAAIASRLTLAALGALIVGLVGRGDTPGGE